MGALAIGCGGYLHRNTVKIAATGGVSERAVRIRRTRKYTATGIADVDLHRFSRQRVGQRRGFGLPPVILLPLGGGILPKGAPKHPAQHRGMQLPARRGKVEVLLRFPGVFCQNGQRGGIGIPRRGGVIKIAHRTTYN
ncbi:hypothetical protein SDC9_172114 [bioreactor metagenome]|uniref:Uncharacterized protein n=1 Tax=bioreactor metagenome TaxID=1076179 RepID=A0A645GFA9_9ZZZZ